MSTRRPKESLFGFHADAAAESSEEALDEARGSSHHGSFHR